MNLTSAERAEMKMLSDISEIDANSSPSSNDYFAELDALAAEYNAELDAAEDADRIAAEVVRFHATGELPPAWTPEVDAEFDARVDEMNRELELEREQIESGSVEPPRFGWLCSIGRGAL